MRPATGPNWTDAFRFIRAQLLLTAHARGVMAIDTLQADYSDPEGLRRVAEASHADGFSGMLAIHPAQVDVINVDEASYMAGARELLQGRLPYTAFGDNKPPLI